MSSIINEEQLEHPFTLYCSFCGIFHELVETLVIGPGVSICDVCVGACKEHIDGRKLLKKNKISQGIENAIKK